MRIRCIIILCCIYFMWRWCIIILCCRYVVYYVKMVLYYVKIVLYHVKILLYNGMLWLFDMKVLFCYGTFYVKVDVFGWCFFMWRWFLCCAVILFISCKCGFLFFNLCEIVYSELFIFFKTGLNSYYLAILKVKQIVDVIKITPRILSGLKTKPLKNNKGADQESDFNQIDVLRGYNSTWRESEEKSERKIN